MASTDAAVASMENQLNETGPVTLTFLGCGTLGTAILTGILDSLTSEASSSSSSSTTTTTTTTTASALHQNHPTNFIACVRSAATVASIQRAVAKFDTHNLGHNHKLYKVTTFQNQNVVGVRRADVVILGCKPYMVSGILNVPGMREALAGKLLISICAGVTAEQIEELLYPANTEEEQQQQSQKQQQQQQKQQQKRCRIVRAMPNTAAVVRESMTVIAEPTNPPLSAEHSALVDWIFSRIGRVVHLPPGNMDVSTALCGSGPAFLALILDGLADGALAMGLPRAEAQLMAAQAMRGAAALVLSGEHPAIIRDKVSTPGGCTIGGLLVLEEAAVRGSIARAVREATEVAGELGKGRTGVNGTRIARA